MAHNHPLLVWNLKKSGMYVCIYSVTFLCGVLFQVVAGTVKTNTVSHFLARQLKQLNAKMYVIKQFAIPFYACTNITSLIYHDNYLQLGCCAQATLLLPGFTSCPATDPCTAPFSLSGDGGNTNGGGSNMNGGSNNSTNSGNGGSPSINSMATMFTSFLLATVALLFHS